MTASMNSPASLPSDSSFSPAPGDRFALVVSRYNSQITDLLREGAFDTLTRHGVAAENIQIVPVPGAFEIPLVAQQLAASGRFAAICCLGAVIQGDTTHHEYINQQVAAGIREAGQHTGVPVLYGVLTLASERAGGKMGNKGSETALAALELVGTLRSLANGNTTNRDEAGSDASDESTGEEEEEQNEDATTPPRRRLARETALQALFQIDLNPEIDSQVIAEFLDDHLTDTALRSFAGRIVEGVHTRLKELDEQLEQQAENWTVTRMAATDRNVLRLAAFELLHSDVPFRVVIDEAVELAKRFGDARSPDFVNGILDAMIPAERRVPATATV